MAERRYHHGDLPAALRAAALTLVDERGPHGFSLAEAARRAGVTVAAPYRHYADREALLAALAVEAFGELAERLRAVPGDGAVRVGGMAAAYVRFAGERTAQFHVLFGAGVDKGRHPAVRRAADAAFGVFAAAVAVLGGRACAPSRDGDRGDVDRGDVDRGDVDRGDVDRGGDVALDVWALAHGYASLLVDGVLTRTDPERAAGAARAATLALLDAGVPATGPGSVPGTGPATGPAGGPGDAGQELT